MPAESFNPSSPNTERTSLELAGALQSIYHNLENRDFTPDIHQDAAIQSLGTALVGGERSGYIEMATGTGKTLIESLLAEAAVRAGRRALILAPSISIADQIVGRSGETGLGRFTNLHQQNAVRRHFGSSRANDTAPIVVSTYHGLINEFRSDSPRLGSFDVIINDECHRSLGAETSRVLTEYMPHAIKLGFSATPDYADDRKAEEVYGKSLFEFSLRSAIEAGTTAPVNPLLYETGATLELSEYRKDFTDAELAPLIDLSERNGVALKLTADLVRDGRQGIIACVPGRDNAHARLMAGLLSNTTVNGRQIIAADVGSHLPLEEQRRRLQAYHRGRIDVLTFTRALEEGWDSNRASFAINMAPTASPVRTKQLLGRILRQKPDGAVSIYIDFIDEKAGIVKQQYTAFHALDLEDIDIHRVLGRSRPGAVHARTNAALFDISALLNPEMHVRLLRSQGKAVQDVLITKAPSTVDPMVAHWERVLAKEGMPAEFPHNLVLTGELANKVDATARALLRNTGDEPTLEQIIETVKAPQYQKKLLGSFAIREEWDESDLDRLPDQDEPTEEVIIRRDFAARIAEVLRTVSEREAGVIRLRHGLTDGEPKTYDQIGEVYGLTLERIRQIESKTRAKLRHPSRRRTVEGYIENDQADDERYRIPQLKDPILAQEFKAAIYPPEGHPDLEAIYTLIEERGKKKIDELYPQHVYFFEHGHADHIRHVVVSQMLRAIQLYTDELDTRPSPDVDWRQHDAKIAAYQTHVRELIRLHKLLNPPDKEQPEEQNGNS